MTSLAAIVDRVHRGHCWIKTADGPRRIDEPLSDGKITAHLANKKAYGACPIAPGQSTTRLALLDLDSHKGETSWEEMHWIAFALVDSLSLTGITAIPYRSSGGQGIHLYMLWDEPQDAYSVRATLRSVIEGQGFTSGSGGVAKKQIEIFPKQDAVPADGYGSMFILPLAGKSEPLSKAGWQVSPSVPLQQRPERSATSTPTAEFKVLVSALKAIPNTDDSPLDYDTWRNIMFAIHHATDGSATGLNLAHEFSARNSKYDADFLDNRVWPYVRTDRDVAITARTIFATARAFGWAEPVEDDFDVVVEASPRKRFEVIPAHEFIQRPAPQWIIQKVLPQAELAVVFGESGSGKSFLVLDMVAAIARGTAWREFATTQGKVVYVAAEGAGGFRNRLKAYARQHDIALEQIPLGIVPDAPNLMKLEDTTALIDAIKAYGTTSVVVVDTFAQVTPGANENAGEDMGKALAHCKRIRAATGALVILIHHSGKDATRGARGWSGLRAAADAEIEIQRSDNDRVAIVTKLKDGEDGAEFGFRLATVPVDEDESGVVSSCVIEHTAVNKAQRVKEPKGAKEKLVLRVVNEMLDLTTGEVKVDEVIRTAVDQLPFDNVEGKRDMRRRDVMRALESLSGAGRVAISGGSVGLMQ